MRLGEEVLGVVPDVPVHPQRCVLGFSSGLCTDQSSSSSSLLGKPGLNSAHFVNGVWSYKDQ